MPETQSEYDNEDSATDPGYDVLALLEEIQRLHEITSRDGGIENKQDLREGHQERVRHHQQRRKRSSRGRRSDTRTPQEIGGNPPSNCSLNRVSFLFGFSIILIICGGTPLLNKLFEHILGMRCFVPNNYLVWEATRPKSDCSFCRGYDGPIILPNMTKEEFEVSGMVDTNDKKVQMCNINR